MRTTTEDGRPRLATVGTIARMLGKNRSTIHYHLKRAELEPVAALAMGRAGEVDWPLYDLAEALEVCSAA